MSSHPPGGDYDESLLDSAPKATRAEKQEGYNLDLLSSDTSETSANTRPAVVIVDGHVNLEIGLPKTKESYDSPCSAPWYRQKKWRIIILVVGIIAIGAAVGGALGGILASKNKGLPPSHGSGPATSSSPNASPSSGALSRSPTPSSLVYLTSTPFSRTPGGGEPGTTSPPSPTPVPNSPASTGVDPLSPAFA